LCFTDGVIGWLKFRNEVKIKSQSHHQSDQDTESDRRNIAARASQVLPASAASIIRAPLRSMKAAERRDHCGLGQCLRRVIIERTIETIRESPAIMSAAFDLLFACSAAMA
jgi:hypothetical protein